MIVRFATVSDRENIFHLLDELIEEVNQRGSFAPKTVDNPTERVAIFNALIERSDVKIFVVEDEKKLLAVADIFILPIVRRGSYHVHIEDFVVTKSLRSKGIGTYLIDAIKSFCKEKNIKVIKLTSGLELTPAHTFYEKNSGEFTEKMFRFDI